MDEKITEQIVKVVVPSYGLRGEFAKKYLNKDEFEKLKAEFINESYAVLQEIGSVVITNTAVEAIFEKTMSPFQYWLENKMACDAINKTGEQNPEVQAEKKRKADTFAAQVGTEPKTLQQKDEESHQRVIDEKTAD